MFDEEVHERKFATMGSVHQRCLIVPIESVNVRAGLQKRSNALQITRSSRVFPFARHSGVSNPTLTGLEKHAK